jgi:hypothetical protein
MLATVAAATLPLQASPAPSDTDALRAEAAKQTAAMNRAAALRPYAADAEPVITVRDEESARLAAHRANARQSHDMYLADVLRAGAGFRPAPIQVVDTDTARLAAAQELRQQRLLADYAEYLRLRARAGTSGSSP